MTLYDADEKTVKRALKANDLSDDLDTLDPELEHLIDLYIQYLKARDKSIETLDGFKYTDGEESVDKSGVYDKHRRFYSDLYNAWRSARQDYKRDLLNNGSFYKIRKRVDRW